MQLYNHVEVNKTIIILVRKFPYSKVPQPSRKRSNYYAMKAVAPRSN